MNWHCILLSKITTSPDFSEKLETEIASMLERAQSLTKEG